MNRNLLDFDLTALLSGDSDCRIGALCEDNSPGPLSVLLGAVGNSLGDLLDILGLDVVRLSECGGLSLVTNKDVDVREDLVEGVLEELRNERSRQVKNKRLDDISLRQPHAKC